MFLTSYNNIIRTLINFRERNLFLIIIKVYFFIIIIYQFMILCHFNKISLFLSLHNWIWSSWSVCVIMLNLQTNFVWFYHSFSWWRLTMEFCHLPCSYFGSNRILHSVVYSIPFILAFSKILNFASPINYFNINKLSHKKIK